MNIPEILDFLKRLSENNTREWFQEHKNEYQNAQSSFENLLADIIARVSLFDESISHVRPHDCTYRIYRDVRFSADKSPYKNHIGGYINARGKKSNHCGYYVHLQPGNCMLAGGAWCLPAPILKAVRQSIADETEEFRNIVENPTFKKTFPVIGESHLKTLPKGFSKDFPYPEYLRPKDYSVCHAVKDDFFHQKDWLEQTGQIFRLMKPFNDFINFTIDEME